MKSNRFSIKLILISGVLVLLLISGIPLLSSTFTELDWNISETNREFSLSQMTQINQSGRVGPMMSYDS